MSNNQIQQLDELDFQILSILLKDCRTPYLEIARICHVSGGTVHVRMKKMEELSIIRGTRIELDLVKLGYDICCFIEIFMDKSSMIESVYSELEKIPEIVELHITSGNFDMFAKLISPAISDLHEIVSQKINTIKGIKRTETFMSLQKKIERNISF